MRHFLTIATLLVLGVFAWLWGTGGFDQLGHWAAERQRGFQNTIAAALRSTRAGEAGAVLTLLSACFAYGVVHAVGPGHGKVLIGGYGVARKVPMLRLSSIALAASLMQAVTAIVLVGAGILLFDLGRQALVGTTENIMAPVSYGAIALIGLWLGWRGARKLLVQNAAPENHDHDHDHGHGSEICASCGHAHGPSLDQVDRVGTFREALVLVAGIAVRPCTGALFVLIITWQMGIFALGVGGAFAMALGTALVTVFVGLMAGSVRGGLLAGLGSSHVLARGMAAIEFLAGAVIVLLATGLLLRAI